MRLWRASERARGPEVARHGGQQTLGCPVGHSSSSYQSTWRTELLPFTSTDMRTDGAKTVLPNTAPASGANLGRGRGAGCTFHGGAFLNRRQLIKPTEAKITLKATYVFPRRWCGLMTMGSVVENKDSSFAHHNINFAHVFLT